MPQPLADLLVVDLSRVLAGPFATMMLADLGARVIKVERPGGGDDSRAYGPFMDAGRGAESMYFARVNRGKESIVLDLRLPADVEVLLALTDRADVLVENFRPGVMDRLGLGYAALSARNPGLIYASISGFGQTGPWRLRPAYDAVVQGASGLMAITGPLDGEPTKSGAPISDLSAGLYAFGAIMAGVHGRIAAGVGTHLDIAMFDTSMSLLEGAALRYLATGAEPPRMGNAHYSIAPFDTFHCADRPIVICAGSDKLFATLCEVLKRPELPGAEPFRTNAARHENLALLKESLEEALTTEPAEVWLDRLERAGVPCGPISDVAAAVGSEQVQARHMVVTAGGLPMAGNPIKGAGWLDGETLPPSPALDEHGLTIRQEFGAAPA